MLKFLANNKRLKYQLKIKCRHFILIHFRNDKYEIIEENKLQTFLKINRD